MSEHRLPRKETGHEEAEFVALAKVTKTQGRKGEVAAALLTDFPERFATRKRLLVLETGGLHLPP